MVGVPSWATRAAGRSGLTLRFSIRFAGPWLAHARLRPATGCFRAQSCLAARRLSPDLRPEEAEQLSALDWTATIGPQGHIPQIRMKGPGISGMDRVATRRSPELNFYKNIGVYSQLSYIRSAETDQRHVPE
jgi:hypothetical protein